MYFGPDASCRRSKLSLGSSRVVQPMYFVAPSIIALVGSDVGEKHHPDVLLASVHLKRLAEEPFP